VICARQGQDLFFAVGIDHDQGHTGGRLRVVSDLGDIDAFPAEVAHSFFSARIGSNPSYEGDARPKSRAGYRLVGSLAAMRFEEKVAIQSFARLRKAPAFYDIIDIGATDDDDVIFFHEIGLACEVQFASLAAMKQLTEGE
jgi:hypothetical protein